VTPTRSTRFGVEVTVSGKVSVVEATVGLKLELASKVAAKLFCTVATSAPFAKMLFRLVEATPFEVVL
jgi:hypothetical protein